MNLAAKILPAPLRSILSLLRGASSEWVGMWIALRHAVREAPPAWGQDLADARVLVVGTGPSLDRITDDYFAGFDVVICVNHAILRVPAHRCVYYFSTDVPRTWNVTQADTHAKIRALPLARRVLFLTNVQTAPYLLSGWLRQFTVGRYYAYVAKCWGRHWTTCTLCKPKQATDAEIVHWVTGRSQLRDMPSLNGSSAFSAMLFIARFRPAEIRLIGVDLNSGRAEALQEVAGGGGFTARAPVEKYRRLEGLIRGCGIPTENDSWTVTPAK